jgi:phosphopantetheinyl transferase
VQRPEVLAQAMAPSERTWLEAQPAASREEALLRLWCAKEAASKFGGRGFEGRPDTYTVSFPSGGADRAFVQCADEAVEVTLQRCGEAVIALAAEVLLESRIH